MSLSYTTFARLRSQMERAEIVLFTGAGFSMGARDRQGRPVPSSLSSGKNYGHSAIQVYVAIEELVNFDHHYWLQRGSLQVQMGDLGLATQFLYQARSLSPDYYLVQTAYCYLLMRKANEHRHCQYAHYNLV